MPLVTVNAGILERMKRGDIKCEILVRVEPDAASNIYTAVSGDTRIEGFANVVAGMTPRRAVWDIKTNGYTLSKMTVTFARAKWLRNIATSFVMAGAKVTMKVGFPDVATSDWFTFFIGSAEDSPAHKTGHFLHCVGPSWTLLTEKVIGNWESLHPLEAAELIYEQLSLGSDQYDSPSHDPTDARWSDRSHYAISRTGKEDAPATPWLNVAIVDPVPAKPLIDELALVARAAILPSHEGKLTAYPIDRTAAVERTLTSDDIVEIRPGAVYRNIINRSSMEIGYRYEVQENLKKAGHTGIVRHQADNESSQAAIAFPGTSERILEERVVSPWLNGVGRVKSFSGSGPWTLVLQGSACKSGFCGLALPIANRHPLGTLRAATQLSAGDGRYAYLSWSWVGSDNALYSELVRATTATIQWAPATVQQIAQDEYNYIWPWDATFTIDTRQLTGGLAVTPPVGSTVYDLTIPYEFTRERVQWLGKGAADLRVRTNVRHMDLDHVSVLALTDDVFSGTVMDGLDSDTAWLVVGKEEDYIGDNPGIWWDLLWMRTVTVETPTLGGTVYESPPVLHPQIQAAFADNADKGLLSHVSKFGDHAVDSTAGLNIVITGGSVQAAGGAMSSGEIKTLTTMSMPAASDIWIYRNIVTGMFEYQSDTPGSSEPAAALGSVLLYKVTTDATAITGTSDLRQFSPLNVDSSGLYFDDAGAIYYDDSGDAYYA